MIIEDRGNKLVLKPAVVLEVERYSDRQIAELYKDDKLSAHEKSLILEKVKTKR